MRASAPQRARRRQLLQLQAQLERQPEPKSKQGGGLVLHLRPAVAGLSRQACRLVLEDHGRLHLVAVLASRAGALGVRDCTVPLQLVGRDGRRMRRLHQRRLLEGAVRRCSSAAREQSILERSWTVDEDS